MSKTQLALIAASIYGAVSSAALFAELRRAPWATNANQFRARISRG